MRFRILISLVIVGGFSEFASASADAVMAIARESSRPAFKSELTLEHASYLRASQPYFGADEKSDQLSTAGVSIKYENRRGRRPSAIDLKAFHSFAEDHTYVNVADLATGIRSESATLVVGRARATFSEADEFWQTGLWQPRFMWDRLRPQTVGLTGLFVKGAANQETTRVQLFASPVYVPEETQYFTENNGKISSPNPWFRPPPPKGHILGDENTEIRSYVDEPEVKDVVLRPSLALRVEQDLAEGIALGAAYGVKPVNQMLLGFRYKMVTANGEQFARVNIAPNFPYHHLFTNDLTVKSGRFKTVVSGTYEKPFRLEDDPVVISQQLREMFAASWTMSYDVLGEGPSATKVYAGIQKAWGALAPDGGEDLSGTTLFEIRQRWFEAYRLGISHPVWSKWRRLQNHFEFTYDRLQNGATLISQVEYNFHDAWIATASLDLLGVFDTRVSEYDTAFIRQYRANDRFSLGLSYVY